MDTILIIILIPHVKLSGRTLRYTYSTVCLTSKGAVLQSILDTEETACLWTIYPVLTG